MFLIGQVLGKLTADSAVCACACRTTPFGQASEGPQICTLARGVPGSFDMGSPLPDQPSPAAFSCGFDPLLSDCIEPVKNTILKGRMILTTHLQYKNRGKLFSDWCTGRNKDSHISLHTILEFLQSVQYSGGSHSIL